MRAIFAAMLLAALSAGDGIPPQNSKKGEPPGVASFEEGARILLEAFEKNDPAVASGFFFPADAFDLVKDLPVPGRYHRKLVRWYEEDVGVARKRFARGTWELEKVELGRCRWKEPGTEGNKVAYWSCRGNFATARQGDRTRRFEIRVLINWGDRWYVTHLGPIRH